MHFTKASSTSEGHLLSYLWNVFESWRGTAKRFCGLQFIISSCWHPLNDITLISEKGFLKSRSCNSCLDRKVETKSISYLPNSVPIWSSLDNQLGWELQPKFWGWGENKRSINSTVQASFYHFLFVNALSMKMTFTRWSHSNRCIHYILPFQRWDGRNICTKKVRRPFTKNRINIPWKSQSAISFN